MAILLFQIETLSEVYQSTRIAKTLRKSIFFTFNDQRKYLKLQTTAIYVSFDSKFNAEFKHVSIMILLKCVIRALYISEWRMQVVTETVHHAPGLIPINIREKDSEETRDYSLTRCTHSKCPRANCLGVVFIL